MRVEMFLLTPRSPHSCQAPSSFFATDSVYTRSKRFDYMYGVYHYYNLGYKVKATVSGRINWALGGREAYRVDRRAEIFQNNGSVHLGGVRKRMITLDDDVLPVPSQFGGPENVLADLRFCFKRDEDEYGSHRPWMTTVALICLSHPSFTTSAMHRRGFSHDYAS